MLDEEREAREEEQREEGISVPNLTFKQFAEMTSSSAAENSRSVTSSSSPDGACCVANDRHAPDDGGACSRIASCSSNSGDKSAAPGHSTGATLPSSEHSEQAGMAVEPAAPVAATLPTAA